MHKERPTPPEPIAVQQRTTGRWGWVKPEWRDSYDITVPERRSGAHTYPTEQAALDAASGRRFA